MDTPTASSSSTPTITPTATPSRVQPGIYNTGHCAPYTIGYYINVNMCVDQVAVQSDYTLIFSISWTMHMPKELQTPPRLDMKVLQMYLIDNLGNRSSVVTAMNWTGSVYVHEGSVISVDLSFPPAAMGALIFTLFDDEHGITISIALSNPVQFYGYMELKKYPFVLRYPLKWWKSDTSGAGDGVLTHLAIANCTITEKSHGAPQGTLINTIAIGPITYQIYRYYAKDYSVREYLAIDGVDNIDSSSPPFLNVTIPFDKAETCLLDASEVLANLQLLSAGNP